MLTRVDVCGSTQPTLRTQPYIIQDGVTETEIASKTDVSATLCYGLRGFIKLECRVDFFCRYWSKK